MIDEFKTCVCKKDYIRDRFTFKKGEEYQYRITKHTTNLRDIVHFYIPGHIKIHVEGGELVAYGLYIDDEDQRKELLEHFLLL